jgi:hypothetical protein
MEEENGMRTCVDTGTMMAALITDSRLTSGTKRRDMVSSSMIDDG